jgi:hypothetical protein
MSMYTFYFLKKLHILSGLPGMQYIPVIMIGY